MVKNMSLNSFLDVINIFKKFVEIDDLDEKAAFGSFGVKNWIFCTDSIFFWLNLIDLSDKFQRNART